MSALLGTFVKLSTMADGTPRIVMDLQCALADVAALGLMPGVAFGIARINGQATIKTPETVDGIGLPRAFKPEIPDEQATIKPGQLCVMACAFCADPRFFDWVDERFMPAGEFMERTETEAKQFILETCGIESRKELDVNKDAAARFHQEIRMPFMTWKAAQ